MTQISGISDLTVIGTSAFEGAGLAGEIMLNKVTWVKSNAFASCHKLKGITLGSNNAILDQGAFYNCSELEKVNLTGTGLKLEYGVFDSCNMLRRLDFPSGLSLVSDRPIKNCSRLEEVSFADDTNIGSKYIFVGCTGLKKITIPYLCKGSNIGKRESGSLAGMFFDGVPSSLEEVKLTGNITKITDKAFYSNTGAAYGIKKVIIPSTVNEIGEMAFCNCNKLSEISDISNVTLIGGSAFSHTGFSDFKIPEGVKTIQGFSYMPNLESVTIPDSATTISTSAFENSGLKSVVIPNGVTSIGENAFKNCNLTEAYISDSVTLIRDRAFANNSDLKKIRFSKDGEIKDGVLEGCYNIESVEMPAWPIYKGGTFSYTGTGNKYSYLYPVFFRPDRTVTKEEMENLPSKYPNFKELIFNNGTSLNLGLKGWKSLERIVLPNTMTSISGMGDTDWFDSFDVFVLPDTITNIGDGAFSGCDNLKELYLPKQIKTVGNSAFSYCDGLEKVYIPANVTFGSTVFRNCSNLHEIEYDKKLTAVADGLFSYCTGLKNVEIPSHIERIGSLAFSNCTNLQNVYIADGVKSIGEGVFDYCNKIKSIVVPDSVTTMDSGTFKYCGGLEELSVPGFDGAREDGTSNTIVYPFITGFGYNYSPNTNYPNELKKVTLTATTILQNNDLWNSPFARAPQTIKEIYLPAVTSVVGDPFSDFVNQNELTVYGHGDAFAELIAQSRFTFVDLDNSTEVEFYSNGGVIEYKFVTVGKLIKEPDTPIRDGYTFEGWYIDEACTEAWHFDFDLVPNTEKMCLFAKWKANHDKADDYAVNIGTNGLEIVNYFGTDSRVNIPEEINNQPVVKINSNAFSATSNIYCINIPKSVSEIEEGAFGNIRKLSEITVDEESTAFCAVDGVLYNKDKTTLICYPTNSGEDYFAIPESVKRIADKAFSFCRLESVYIPDSVEEIGNEAFYNCQQLVSVSLPESIKTIGEFAFDGISASITGPVENEVINTYFADNNIAYNMYLITFMIDDQEAYKINVQAGTKLSAEEASVADGLEYYGKKITTWINDSTEAEFNIREDIMPQEDIVLEARYDIDVAYRVNNGYVVVTGIGNGNGSDPIIPETINGLGVTTIAENAFTDIEIKSVTIPDCITTIAENAFNSDVTIICNKDSKAYTYAGNHGLTVKIRTYRLSYETNGGKSVVDVFLAKGDKISEFPDTSKPNCVFEAWYKDEECTEVWDIDQDVMPAEDITIYAAWNIIEEGADDGFVYEEKDGTLKIVGYIGKSEYIEIPSTIGEYEVTSIDDGAFIGNKNVRIVNIPNSVTVVGKKAFFGCSSLEEIEGGMNIKEIGNYAFAGCTNLNELDLSGMNSLRAIPDRCFMSDTNLLDISLPSGISEIGDFAFSGCTYLENVNIPSGVTSIGEYAFYCNEMTNTLVIPASVVEIGSGFADGCSKLVNITVDVNNSAYKSVNGVLYNKSLTKIVRCPEGKSGAYTISKGVVSIESGAFKGCSLLTGISISTGVKEIGENAFYRCTGVMDLVLPTMIETISERAFAYCNSLKTIEIGRNVISISANAFEGNFGLTVKGYEGTAAETIALADDNLNFEYVLTGSAAKPLAPVVKNIRNTTVELEQIAGYEYKVNNGAWQKSNVFDNLQPLTKYSFYQRIASDKGCKASVQSTAVIATTGKLRGQNLKNVVICGITSSSISAAYVEGSEYSLDGINWQKSNEFTGLQNNTEYTIYQRMAETKTSDSGNIVTIEVTTGGEVVTVTLDANGGYFVSEGTEKRTVLINKGKKVILDGARKEGYELDYWSLNGEKFDFNTAITDSIALVANWKEIEITEKCQPPYVSSSYIKYGDYIYLGCYEPENASIYYTVDGSIPEPGASNTIEYTEPILSSELVDFKGQLYSLIHINSMAVCDGYLDSDITSSDVGVNHYVSEYDDCEFDDYVREGLYFSHNYAIPYDGFYNDIEENDEIGPYMVYTGSKLTPGVVGFFNGRELKQGVDYTISYSNNVNVGKMTITMTGKGNYKGKKYTEQVTIVPLDISTEEFSADDIVVEYVTNKAQKPAATLFRNGKKLTTRDYSVSWKNEDGLSNGAFKTSGVFSVEIEGKGNYTGKRIISYEITPKHSLQKASIGNIATQTWSGEAIEPKPDVKLGGKTLVPDQDYVITYSDNINSGKALFKIEGIGDYYGEKQKTFTIKGTALSKVKVTGYESKMTFSIPNYDDTECEINQQKNVELTYNGEKLIKGVDYTESYNNLDKVGKATVEYNGCGKFEGKIKKTYSLVGKNIKDMLIKNIEDEYVFDGKPIESYPWVYYYDENGEYQSLSNYDQCDITYKNNDKPGTGTIVIKGKGDYYGTITVPFKIVPFDISTDDEFYYYPNNNYTNPEYTYTYYSKGGTKLPSSFSCDIKRYKAIDEGKHFTLGMEKITNAYGEDYKYKLVIKGKGLLTGSRTIDLVVYKSNIQNLDIQVNDLNISKSKTNFVKPIITDTTGIKSAKLEEGIDYEIVGYKYEKDVTVTQSKDGKLLHFVRRAGDKVEKDDIIPCNTSIKIHVRGINNYEGEFERIYRVYDKDISKANVTVKAQKFSAHDIIPKKSDIKIVVNKQELSAKDYEIVDCINNYNVGTATMIIRGKGECGGEKKVTFKIVY